MTAVDESSGNVTQPQGAPTMSDQQPRWEDPIFRAGHLVGAALFAIGILCQTSNLIAPSISILGVCSGLGIILGAFGATAVINCKGFAVALTEILRNRRGDRNAVSAMLADDDLKLPAGAVADDDRTLRVYASEFFRDLGDPRILPIVVRPFVSAREDGRDNLIPVMGGAVPNLAAVDTAALRRILQSWEALVGPNTDKLIARS